ncbi:MAG: nucleoside 2-deoxyribosyltransferase, partial [Planctomycetes bacterium]|nr:nucleoside 2-deoxyribosyltransferase [Planctomycetota bacterium]
ARYGFEGVFPMDPIPGGRSGDEGDPRDIFRVCVEHMERCDILIADMTPFCGPSMDVGTAFEMGFAKVRGIPVIGYSDVRRPYNERVATGTSDEGSPSRDVDGLLIEEFGLQDNLMVALCCSDSEVHPSLETALDAAAASLGR